MGFYVASTWYSITLCNAGLVPQSEILYVICSYFYFHILYDYRLNVISVNSLIFCKSLFFVKTFTKKILTMSKKSNYTSTNRSKHYLKAHIIFAVKYRKPLMVGQLNEDMKQLLQNISVNSDFEIEIMESDVNHIHFLIKYIPRLSITSIVRKLKQESTFSHLAYASSISVKSILERANFLVRWLFCLLNWRNITRNNSSIYFKPRLIQTHWSLISHQLKTNGFYAPNYKLLYIISELFKCERIFLNVATSTRRVAIF